MIMRLSRQKDGDLASYFDKINEREGTGDSSLKHLLIDSHTNEDNKGKIRADLPLEDIFSFCKTNKKNKRLRIKLKTSDEKKNFIHNPRRQ